MAETAASFGGTAAPSDGGAVQALDPRGRIVFALLFAVIVVSLTDLRLLLGCVVFALGILRLSRLSPGVTIRRVLTVDGFILFLLVMLPFTTPGETWFSLGPLTASVEGGILVAGIAFKANAIMLVLLSLVGTIEATVLGHALHRLRLPESLIHLLLFTMRYIGVLQREYTTLRSAMKARGFRLRTDLHTYRSIGYLLGMMLIRSLERSERILQAMKCRGFCGRFFVLDELHWRQRDNVFALLGLILFLTLLVLEHRHVFSTST